MMIYLELTVPWFIGGLLKFEPNAKKTVQKSS